MGHNRVNKSRRDFIKSAAAAGSLLAAGLINPFNAVIFASEKPKDPTKPWWGYGIDIEKCIGCAQYFIF